MGKVEHYLLGMDCGTTNIKAIILGEDGSIAAEAGLPSRFLRPGPDMQEQDAMEWWSNAAYIIKTLCEQAGPQIVKKIRGISVSSHTVSLLPVDAAGNPLREAMTYQDSRSVAELNDILNEVGRERFIRIVGGQPSVAFLPNKILWYKKNEPELFAKTAFFMQASSFINYKLTGVMTSDIDQATRTQCLDISTMNWSDEIGNAIGVDLHKRMPPLKLVNEIIGTVTEKASAQTGLPAGIPVIAGCSDAMASMFATGMGRLGEAGESSGTSSLVFVGSDTKSAPDVAVVTKPCPIDSMPWVFDAPIQSSGAALRWFIETMGAQEWDYADSHNKDVFVYLNEIALQAVPGAHGLFFFPYLMGERAPLWNDYARGMFIGMGSDMQRSEFVRSVFEGTAYALRHVMETIKEAGGKADSLRICGGGAKSRTWSMIKASMLKMPVSVLDERSGDVPVGDALIVGHKVGVFPDLPKASERIVKVKEVIQPIDEWAKVYDQLYPYYIDMYRHLDEDLKNLKQTIACM
ncbi:MAG: carbohydrate kinase [Eubacterium sp.]|nr:carbohydrate kinase [Eubacterium sp.]